MKKGMKGLFFLIAFFLQVTVINHIRIGETSANLILCLSVFFAMIYMDDEGLIFGTVTGLLYDISFSPMIGPIGLACMLSYLMTRFVKRFLSRENLFSLLIAGALASLVFYSVIALLTSMAGEVLDRSLWLTCLAQFVLANSIIYLILYIAIGRRTIKYADDKNPRGNFLYYE